MKKSPVKTDEPIAFKIKKPKVPEEKIAKHWNTVLIKIKNKKSDE